MRMLFFILLWIGIISIIILMNYHPKKIIKKNKKIKKRVKPPYIYLILGLIFLPIATVFISSIVIYRDSITPYLIITQNYLSAFIRSYDIVCYIIIVEVVMLFTSSIIKSEYINKIIKYIVKFAISISILLFLLGFIIHLS